MIFAGELPVCLADFVFGSGPGDAERFVVVVFWGGCHLTPTGRPSGRWTGWKAGPQPGKAAPHYFLSSTSTNSASTTSSFGFSPPAPSDGGGGAPAPGWDALYIASASLWLAWVNLSVAAFSFSASLSLMD